MIPPKITIITPTLNVGETIESALLSVANQSYQNTEHIIVDGASKDKTLPTIRRHQKTHKNIRLLTEKDTGIYNAMNKGLDLCTGDWIFFLGADDSFYNENVLKDLFEQGLFQEEQVVYGNVIIKGDSPWAMDGSTYDGPFTLEKLFKWNICHQSIFYPRSVIQQVGYYNTKYEVTSDWDYNMRCWARYKFTYTDKIIAFFTTGGKSSQGGDYALHLDFPDNVIKYFQLDVLDSNLYLVTSPFYYPMSRYRENEYVNNIQDLKTENETLKHYLEGQKTEHAESMASLKTQHEESMASLKTKHAESMASLKTQHEESVVAMRAAFEQVFSKFKTGQEAFLANLNAEHSAHVDDLKTEKETLKHYLEGQKTEHAESMASLKTQHEESVVAMRAVFEQVFSKFKTGQEAFLANLNTEHAAHVADLKTEKETLKHYLEGQKTEHAKSMASLKTQHEESMALLKTQNEESVSSLKTQHEESVVAMRTAFEQVFSNFKTGQEAFLANLNTEHAAHVADLKTESARMITALNEQHAEMLNTLRIEHAATVSSIREGYEENIRALKDEKQSFWEMSLAKEAEFMKVVVSNNQHTAHLTQTMEKNDLYFRETLDRYNDAVARLSSEINSRQQEIETIHKSYTWKTGKALLYPAIVIVKLFTKK